MAVVVKRNEVPFTYRDYASWPDDERWELIDGVAYDMCATPSRHHQAISVVLSMNFFNYFKGNPAKSMLRPSMWYCPIRAPMIGAIRSLWCNRI